MDALRLSAILTSALLVACGEDAGIGVVTVKTGLTSEDARGASSGADAGGTLFTVTSARVHVAGIDFRRKGEASCDDVPDVNQAAVTCEGNTVHANGPFDFDLVSRVATPTLDGLTIPGGSYDLVDLRVETSSTGNTLELRGSFLDPENNDTVFEASLAYSSVIHFQGEQFTLAKDGTRAVTLELDVSRWFETLRITECLEEGELVINDGKLLLQDSAQGDCNEIQQQLIDGMGRSGRFQ